MLRPINCAHCGNMGIGWYDARRGILQEPVTPGVKVTRGLVKCQQCNDHTRFNGDKVRKEARRKK